MKSKAVHWISGLSMGLIFLQALNAPFAYAEERAFVAVSVEEVPEDQAERIDPLTDEFWEKYRRAGDEPVMQGSLEANSLNLPAIAAGTIVLDAMVNLGKKVWDIIEKGKPKVDISMDTASAVPKGITHWTQLEGWRDPISKLYRAQLLQTPTLPLGDIYFRLVFLYGGSVAGKGKYLANVAIMPAQMNIPYLHNVFARSQVLELMNQGTKTNPVAGMTLQLQWGQHFGFLSNEIFQSVGIHIRGDGVAKILPAGSEKPENLKPPIVAPRPPWPL